jgi:hypothetical protein
MPCDHTKRVRVYRRGPKSEGSKFLPHGYVCPDCGKHLSD